MTVWTTNMQPTCMYLLTLATHTQWGLWYLVVCVCVCVCLLIHIWPLERLFILKMPSHTHPAMEIKIFVGFSLKLLHCRDTLLLALYGYPCSRPFWKPRMCIAIVHAFSRICSRVAPRVLHFSAFILYMYDICMYECIHHICVWLSYLSSINILKWTIPDTSLIGQRDSCSHVDKKRGWWNHTR